MVRKGKFYLLSYAIEGPLIFYKSTNRSKKILAFSVIETENYYPLIQILNDFLNKRYIKYFSIQLKISDDKKKLFILNFEETNKSEIVKLFNLVNQKLIQYKNYLNVLTKEGLEEKFLDVFDKNLAPNLSILKTHDSIVLKNHKSSTLYNFYALNLDRILNQTSFIHNFLKLAHNFNINGFLIFNLKLARDSIINFAIYFVEINNNREYIEKIDYKINNFYHDNVLTKNSIRIKSFFNLLWRSELLNNRFLFNDFSELFNCEDQYDYIDLIKFNSQFETNLLRNNIKFKRLNKNLLFIEDCLLFYSSPLLESKMILNILTRYSSRFYIYILVMKDEQYEELLKIKKIELLKNVVALNLNKFNKLDYTIFKDLKGKN